MEIDIRTFALLHLIVQFLIILTVIMGVYLFRKGKIRNHCKIMPAALVVQILTVVFIMAPAMSRYVEGIIPNLLFNIELWVHHIVGLVVILLGGYIYLGFRKKTKFAVNRTKLMKFTFWMWILTFLIGLHLYLMLWLGTWPL
jgi:putative membrane protein